LILAPCIASADLDRGIEAFNKGDHSVALQELKPVAKAGDAEAQFYSNSR
jgi:hypothetical protein